MCLLATNRLQRPQRPLLNYHDSTKQHCTTTCKQSTDPLPRTHTTARQTSTDHKHTNKQPNTTTHKQVHKQTTDQTNNHTNKQAMARCACRISYEFVPFAEPWSDFEQSRSSSSTISKSGAMLFCVWLHLYDAIAEPPMSSSPLPNLGLSSSC